MLASGGADALAAAITSGSLAAHLVGAHSGGLPVAINAPSGAAHGESPVAAVTASAPAEGVATVPAAETAVQSNAAVGSAPTGPMREGVMVAGIQAGFNASNDFYCGFCGLEVSPLRVRLHTKGAAGRDPVFKCTTCNTRIVQLARAFNGWPTESFKGLDIEAKRAFMREIAEAKGAHQVMLRASKLLQSYEEHEEFYAEGGDFLPLEVWQSRGFNSANILNKSKPSDIRMCPVLGRTFRVPIISGGKRGVKGSRRVDDLKEDGQQNKELKRELKKLKRELDNARSAQLEDAGDDDDEQGEMPDEESTDSEISSELPENPKKRAKKLAEKKKKREQKATQKAKAAKSAAEKAEKEAKKDALKQEAMKKKAIEGVKKIAQSLLPLITETKQKLLANSNHPRSFTKRYFYSVTG